jgi:toxin HigB-1
VILSCATKNTERIWNRERVKTFPPTLHRVTLRKLVMLDAAITLEDVRMPPGNKLERLRGRRTGQYSIRINDQWRICFDWQNGNAYNVEVIDYH